MLSSLLGSLDARGGGLGALGGEARLELCRTLGFDQVPPGKAVCTEGEPGHSFYVVLYGTLEVSQKRGEGSLVREVRPPLTRWCVYVCMHVCPGARLAVTVCAPRSAAIWLQPYVPHAGAPRAPPARRALWRASAAQRQGRQARRYRARGAAERPVADRGGGVQAIYTYLPIYLPAFLPILHVSSSHPPPIHPSTHPHIFLIECRRIVREGQLEALRETMEFVKSVGPFQHMPAEQLEQLCRVLRPQLVGAGEVVQRQGGAAQGMYIVRWGRLVEERTLLLEQGDRCTRCMCTACAL